MAEHRASSALRVQSVDRALNIVDLLGEPRHSSGLGLGNIAQHLGVSKSTALNLLATLRAHGLISRVEPGPRFLLGVSLMRLGDQVREAMPLARLADPVLHALAAETGLTARLVVSDHGRPLYVARAEGIASIRFSAQIGLHEPAHSTGVGKAILASLDDAKALDILRGLGMAARTEHTIITETEMLNELARIREQGYALDIEEEAIGIVCAAAAITDPSGYPAGALSVSGLKAGMAHDLPHIAKVVKAHADSLTRLLAGH